MASLLSSLVNNLSEGIQKINRKCGYDAKKCETCEIKYCFLEYTNFKDDLIKHEWLCCTKNYQEMFDEKLKEQFLNT